MTYVIIIEEFIGSIPFLIFNRFVEVYEQLAGITVQQEGFQQLIATTDNIIFFGEQVGECMRYISKKGCTCMHGNLSLIHFVLLVYV